MKLYIPALVAVLAVALTGCGGDGKPAADTTSKPTVSATAKQRAIVPDLVGKSAIEAKSHLDKLNYRARFFGPDGQSWSAKTQVDDTVLTVSTSPAAGGFSGNDFVDVKVNMTEKEFLTGATARAAAKEVADAEANIAKRYTYRCGADREYKSFKEAWGSSSYKDGGGPCTVKIQGIPPSSVSELLPSEQKLVDAVTATGVTIRSGGETLGRILNLCAKLDNTWGATYMDKPTTPESRAEAAAALTLCPDAPHVADLQSTVSTPRVADGTMVVGQGMEPGTWKTKPGVKGCYWSRSAGDGTILANDIVDFAPAGVTVTVATGEGFKSNRCGVWSKIG